MTSSLLPDTKDKASTTPRTNTVGATHSTSSAGGFIKAIESGSKHLIIKRLISRTET